MKKLLGILLAVFMVFGLVGCADKTYEIAVVTDVGQLNDGGFNQFTYEGAKSFAEDNNLTYNYYQPANGENATDKDRVAAMHTAIENGAKVIVCPGFMQAAALAEVANESKDVMFVFVDGWTPLSDANGKTLDLQNLTAIVYAEQEAGYFAGYAAAKDGYTKLGGTFGGGATNPACNRYCFGYIQGIQAAAKELGATVDVKVSFKYGDGFSASAELQTQIAGWYKDGYQVVFSCGGSMLQSVKAAAAEYNGAKIIGVDVDQSGEGENVITSACKGLSASVYQTLEAWKAGKWSSLAGKTTNKTAADKGTEIPTNDKAWRFSKFTKEEYKAVFDKVVSGAIKINAKCDNLKKFAENADWQALVAACPNVNLVVEE